MTIYTPKPENDDSYIELMCVVTEDKAWKYVGCLHHMKEFLKATRAAGDTFKYFGFHRSVDTFCAVCWAFDTKKDNPDHMMLNQVSYATWTPGGGL